MPRADRLIALMQLLSGPARRTLDQLTRELEASPRSIYRDLADLEVRGFAIERDEGRYRLLDAGAVRSIPLTARERLLLTMALENPTLDRQAAFRSILRQVRLKLAARRDASTPVMLAGPERSGAVEPSIVEAIENAIGTSHSVSLLYTSLNSGEQSWRGIDPWALLHRAGAWYLIGRCHRHDQPRTFRLDRIGAVLPIGSSFARPADFDPEQWFANSWEVASSGDAVDVVVMFDSSVAPLIEHALHHPSETKTRLPDGRIEYRVRIGPLDEIARWIVGFGGKAVAAEPPELVELVREIAEGAAEVHEARVTRKRAAMVRRER